MCVGLLVGNNYCKHKSMFKHMKVERCLDGMEVMEMIYFVMVKRDMVKHVHDGKTVRVLGRGVSYYLVVRCIDKSVDTWIKKKD